MWKLFSYGKSKRWTEGSSKWFPFLPLFPTEPIDCTKATVEAHNSVRYTTLARDKETTQTPFLIQGRFWQIVFLRTVILASQDSKYGLENPKIIQLDAWSTDTTYYTRCRSKCARHNELSATMWYESVSSYHTTFLPDRLYIDEVLLLISKRETLLLVDSENYWSLHIMPRNISPACESEVIRSMTKFGGISSITNSPKKTNLQLREVSKGRGVC